MILLRRAPNGAPRALASLTRPSPRPARTSPPPRFSSTTATPPPSSADADAAAKPTPQPDQQQQQQQQQQQAPPPRRHRRSLRPLIYSTLFLAAGLVTGNIVRFTIAPPPLPDPDTDMDDALQGKLREELDALPQVREHERLTATEAEWVEVGPWGALVARSRADSGVDVGGKKEWFGGWLGGEEREKEGGEVVVFEGLLGDEKHAVSQTLAAMKGFGPARKFVNKATRETVLVFWVGGGLTGWPGVAHGGALATAFLEAFGSPEQKRTAEPAKLTLTYLAPTMASNFFVLKAAPSPAPAPSTELPPQKDMTKRPVPSEERPDDGGEEWSGTLQAVQGRVCVKAKAVLAR